MTQILKLRFQIFSIFLLLEKMNSAAYSMFRCIIWYNGWENEGNSGDKEPNDRQLAGICG